MTYSTREHSQTTLKNLKNKSSKMLQKSMNLVHTTTTEKLNLSKKITGPILHKASSTTSLRSLKETRDRSLLQVLNITSLKKRKTTLTIKIYVFWTWKWPKDYTRMSSKRSKLAKAAQTSTRSWMGWSEFSLERVTYAWWKKTTIDALDCTNKSSPENQKDKDLRATSSFLIFTCSSALAIWIRTVSIARSKPSTSS